MGEYVDIPIIFLERPLTEKQKIQITSMVDEMMGHMDCSHNAEHAHQIAYMACKIAEAEKSEFSYQSRLDLDLVWTLGMLHDVWDHKYPKADEKKEKIYAFLEKEFNEYFANQLVELVDKVSWSKEQKLLKEGKQLKASHLFALQCVQDADRLQAIGAIGIARCFGYGGMSGAPLMEQRRHFDEKLFRITFKTKTGQKLAEERFKVMREFIKAFDNEIEENTP